MKSPEIHEKQNAFLKKYRWGILTWIVILIVIELGIYFHWDKSFLAIGVVLLGVAGQAFGTLIAWIALIPLVGPVIVQVLSLPFIWLINGFGYIASVLAIKKGHSISVVNFRAITIIFLVGLTFGYILGKVL
jgi:hypothetical protein